MRTYGSWTAVIAVAVCLFLPNAASAQKRLALVIGNSSYKNFAPVKTAEKDATDIAAVLNLAGFAVVLSKNLDSAVMKKAVEEFKEIARDADLVAFYFGGQAIQTGGANYLMPVDASNTSRQAAIDDAISLDQIIRTVPKNAAMVVFLDAPRNDPFVKQGEKDKIQFADAAGPRFIHIAFATAPGSPIAPFIGENSAFATAILKHIKRPDLPLEQLDKAVRTETANLTNNRQIAWSSATGTQEVVFFSRAR